MSFFDIFLIDFGIWIKDPRAGAGFVKMLYSRKACNSDILNVFQCYYRKNVEEQLKKVEEMGVEMPKYYKPGTVRKILPKIKIIRNRSSSDILPTLIRILPSKTTTFKIPTGTYWKYASLATALALESPGPRTGCPAVRAVRQAMEGRGGGVLGGEGENADSYYPREPPLLGSRAVKQLAILSSSDLAII